MNQVGIAIHPSHRMVKVVPHTFMSSTVRCEVCGNDDCYLDDDPGGKLKDICPGPPAPNPEVVIREKRQKEMLATNRVIVDLGFSEVRGSLLVAFLDQVERCSKTLAGLDLVVCITGSREYAGMRRYGVVVTIPAERYSNEINVRRWFDGGTWP